MGNLPTSIVIFGITGDLARNKLIPALFDLHSKGKLDPCVNIIGFGRKPFSAEEFSSFISDLLITKVPESETVAMRQRHKFIQSCTYIQGELNQLNGYAELKKKIPKGSRALYFLSVHPELHEIIIPQLGNGLLLNKDSQVMIEKPFGHNVKTAVKLDKKLCKFLKEDQVYRIDHYLGKSPLINFLELRRSDPAFEHALENEMKEISVSLLEKKTIHKRGAFYDPVGALKDVGQNHLLQMLAVAIAPKEITSNNAHKVQNARAIALNSLHLNLPAVRAQYIKYHDEPGVAPHSQTETFFSISTSTKLPKHKGVCICMSAGKALSVSKSEIKITFKKPIKFSDGVKKEISFSLNEPKIPALKSQRPMEAYERIFLAALEKDQSFFCSIDEVVAGWKFDNDVRKFWQKESIPLKKYKIGTSAHIPKK